ncbi:MAG: porin family protein [Bacteroidota bacterium]
MKKSLFTTLFVAALMVHPLYSQFSIGPRIGISSSKVQVDETYTNNGEEITYSTDDAKVGFHAGAFARLNLAGLYVQPELLFTSSGGKIAVESEDRGKEIWNLTYNKLDVPVMVGVKVLKFIRLQAGPTFSLLLSSDARDVDVYDTASNNYNNATVGYQAGVGFDIGSLYIDFKYEGNLSKLGDSVNFGNQEFNTDMRNTLLMLVVGINLL